ncbi:OPT oligopeptide transporter [Dothidotthia symphoricarpi CBS 119687]|uniref:OPT oligopeptide transporter n=1 Tax=Dothidotthia symphoricarpi CBS 119687 TaxID=1392245 RepID=A0A6A6APW4_9PLEO|nr:OPT oligopeptide transporter [Dothidotthia symphoricarpi CBS 119687]KAF2133576.1 OPT oligopeptide transporter [Dothidotthia symphoricarpi CBS 119687]
MTTPELGNKATAKAAQASEELGPVHLNKDIEFHTTETTSQARLNAEDTTAAVEEEAQDDPEIAQLPLIVRQLVSLDDDTTLPTITFRYFVLCVVFVVPGAFLSQMSHFRTTQAPYSIFFVQIACHYAGHFLAERLPAWQVRLPLGYGFNLNPAPWSIKEHVLVTLTAASGATYNLGYTPISMAELYYDTKIDPAVAIFFMLAIVWVGYAIAAIARSLLLWEPEYIWPQALMQTTLFETFRKQDRRSKLAKRQMIIFFSCLIGMTLWQFLPEYIFPFTSSLALLCWVAPKNSVANFIGSGLGGMGFLNLSLDWSNINWNGSSILITPFWTQTILFLAFAFNCWILIPAAKWGNLGSYKHGLMSNSLLMANGTKYPTLKIVNSDFSLNQTAYEEYGPVYMGIQNIWATFFSYAKLPSAFIWMATFGATQIMSTFKKNMAARRARAGAGKQQPGSHGPAPNIHHQYTDRLNVLQRSYKEVPGWWFGALFLAGLVMLVAIIGSGQLFVPVWTVFVALATGVVIVVPLGYLYAISNYQVAIGDFNELMYGYMVHTSAGSGHHHPCGPSVYGSIAGDAWYRAQYMLQDQRIGHYMHIPPRTVFFSQVFGSVLGIPINYGVVRWVLNTKFDYLSGAKSDPLHQWTGQSLVSSNTLGVQYAVIGPSRMFSQHVFKPLPWAFLFGTFAPLVLFALHRAFPKSKLKFHLWNTTIFFSGMAVFYGNLSTGYFSAYVGGFIAMYWIFRYHFQVWKRYNYIVAAALDAAFNLNMLLIFLFFGSGKQISMPNWWGNNEDNIERCFALE